MNFKLPLIGMLGKLFQFIIKSSFFLIFPDSGDLASLKYANWTGAMEVYVDRAKPHPRGNW